MRRNYIPPVVQPPAPNPFAALALDPFAAHASAFQPNPHQIPPIAYTGTSDDTDEESLDDDSSDWCGYGKDNDDSSDGAASSASESSDGSESGDVSGSGSDAKNDDVSDVKVHKKTIRTTHTEHTEVDKFKTAVVTYEKTVCVMCVCLTDVNV